MSDHQNPERPSTQSSQASVVTAAPPVSRRRDELGAAALTIVLCLLLIDAAVETFLGGAPVRWWVAGVVAVYLGLTAFVWRASGDRFGWSMRATASFLALLGVLALTAWLPDGLTNGVAMLTQPTSVVLSAVSAIAVAVAGLLLLRVRFLPWWGRAALGLLALYHVAAFAVGVIEGTPYADLFQGESLWRRLPYWLQGAFIGALIAVPLAMVAAIVDTFRRLRTADRRNWGLQQSLALGLATLVAVSGITVNSGPVFGVTDPGRAGPQLSASEIAKPLRKSQQELSQAAAGGGKGGETTQKEAIVELENLFQAVKGAQQQIPRDTFDPLAIVAKAGTDPEKLFVWVRDNTYLVPYRGLLRGDTGVLLDRMGNSLDRAMLLQSLLRAAGRDVRLAHATLSEQQAKDVLGKARPIPAQANQTTQPSSTEAVDAFVAKYPQQVDGGTLRKALEKVASEQQRVAARVQERTRAQTEAIAGAVGEPPKDVMEAEAAAGLAAIRDHWWVQWKDGANWVDLDPTLGDAKSGQVLIPATETLVADKLPESIYHQVEVRVIVERWQDAQLKELRVFNHTLRPFELHGKQIALRHVPTKWPKDLNLFAERNPRQSLQTTLVAQEEWLPVLNVGETPNLQSAFTVSAEVVQKPFAPVLGAGGQTTGSRVGNILGGGAIGNIPAREPSKTPAHLTAEWIEYEIRVPGRPPHKIRREMFDLVGPAARSAGKIPALTISEAQKLERGMALIGETDILLLASRITPEFFDHEMSRNVLANREVLMGLLGSIDRLDPKSLLAKASELSWLSGNLYVLTLARREWSRFQQEIYLAAPNVVTYRRQLRVGSKGEMWASEGFDIVANDVAVHPRSTGNPFRIRLEQGVLDTNAEALVATVICQAAKGESACGRIENTAELFVRSTALGIDWPIFKEARDLERRLAGLPMDIRARIGRELAAGYFVLVPEEPIPEEKRTVVGWWRIDPRTGQTLGIGDRGWGATATEYTLLKATVTGAVVGASLNFLACYSEEAQSLADVRSCSDDAICGALFGAIGGALFVLLAGGPIVVSGPGYFTLEGARAASRLAWFGPAAGAAGTGLCQRLPE